MKPILSFLLIPLVLCACTGTAPNSTDVPFNPNDTVTSNNPDTKASDTQPYQPQPGDDAMTRGQAFLDSADLLILESYPVQIMLIIKGSLPTPCHQLRVAIDPPDEKNQIQVDLYSVIEPNQICVQVEEPFERNVGLGSFPTGHYSIWNNGEIIAEFDA